MSLNECKRLLTTPKVPPYWLLTINFIVFDNLFIVCDMQRVTNQGAQFALNKTCWEIWPEVISPHLQYILFKVSSICVSPLSFNLFVEFNLHPLLSLQIRQGHWMNIIQLCYEITIYLSSMVPLGFLHHKEFSVNFIDVFVLSYQLYVQLSGLFNLF